MRCSISRAWHLACGIAVWVAAGSNGALAQRVLNVPSEYPTIQAGIDAAQTNDTVLVAEGTYSGPGNVDLNFRGKAITVRGENGLARVNDSAGGARLVTFNSGETPSAVFEGFIVDFASGTGIYIDNSSPTIRNCELVVLTQWPVRLIDSEALLADLEITGNLTEVRIDGGEPTLTRVAIERTNLQMTGATVSLTDCSVSRNTSGRVEEGAGMALRQCSAVLIRCNVSFNVAGQDGGSFGAGLYIDQSDVELIDCTIHANISRGHHDLIGQGGGVYQQDSQAIYSRCVFSSNQAKEGGGGVYVIGGGASFNQCRFTSNSTTVAGGGAHTRGPSVFTDCEFTGNSSTEAGGGAYSLNEASFIRCTFSRNWSLTDYIEDFGGGAGLYTANAPPVEVIDSLFYENRSVGDDALGGALHAGPNTTIRGCSFVSNHAQADSGGVYFDGPNSTMANCVLWGNTDDEGLDQIRGIGTVTWCNVQDGYPGEGNIDEDPRFIDPVNDDYRLGNASPCIDAGNNSLVPPESEFDLDGNPRFVNDLGMPEMGEGTAPLIDMGCYEFQDRSTGLNLRAVATCPGGGPARVGCANATPQGDVALLFAQATGRVRVPDGLPCVGTRLGLGSAGLRVVWRGSTGPQGERTLNTSAPPRACGAFVQLLDLSTCEISNVVGVD